ncbi:MAG: hypothetical protein NTY28_13400 [Janthinobacterium sp.]|nr:hypothetical protein [Janthinobacterium sp.]MCX7292053.1 hypothetical protein [Janthinobacterium sp.]
MKIFCNGSLPPDNAGQAVTYRSPIFALGAAVATPGALDLLDRAGTNASTYLARHQSGDFGSICLDDEQANRVAILHGFRILSAYKISDEKLWVITEADRSATTLLLPSEY